MRITANGNAVKTNLGAQSPQIDEGSIEVGALPAISFNRIEKVIVAGATGTVGSPISLSLGTTRQALKITPEGDGLNFAGVDGLLEFTQLTGLVDIQTQNLGSSIVVDLSQDASEDLFVGRKQGNEGSPTFNTITGIGNATIETNIRHLFIDGDGDDSLTVSPIDSADSPEIILSGDGQGTDRVSGLGASQIAFDGIADFLLDSDAGNLTAVFETAGLSGETNYSANLLATDATLVRGGNGGDDVFTLSNSNPSGVPANDGIKIVAVLVERDVPV